MSAPPKVQAPSLYSKVPCPKSVAKSNFTSKLCATLSYKKTASGLLGSGPAGFTPKGTRFLDFNLLKTLPS